jgi:hypothetical protein
MNMEKPVVIDPSYSSLLTVGGAAAVLGVSTARVRQLDAVLEPLRISSGQRIYRRETVEKIARERAVSRQQAGGGIGSPAAAVSSKPE